MLKVQVLPTVRRQNVCSLSACLSARSRRSPTKKRSLSAAVQIAHRRYGSGCSSSFCGGRAPSLVPIRKIAGVCCAFDPFGHAYHRDSGDTELEQKKKAMVSDSAPNAHYAGHVGGVVSWKGKSID